MKKTALIILTIILTMMLFVGCSPNTSNQDGTAVSGQSAKTAAPKDLLDEDTDALGNTVIAKGGETDRLTIVSTAPSTTEILFALGCGDKIVGVDVYSTYPDEASNIEKVGDFNGFDIEKVIALNPSVVFAGNGLQLNQIHELEAAGLFVVATEATYYEDIVSSITLIGSVVGKKAEAAALNEQIADAAAKVKEKASKIEDKPTVYYVMGIGEYGNWTSGEGSFINTVIEMAGGVCITAGSESEWLNYPVENLIMDDPDILLVSEGVTEQALLSETGYKDLSAINNGTYYFISPDMIERPGPRIAQVLEIVQRYVLGE
ncbi:MAG: ABC transporter substrate-binding protein [Christensenellales bacterium]|jgi:iron complex transport system substrate-binding protein